MPPLLARPSIRRPLLDFLVPACQPSPSSSPHPKIHTRPLPQPSQTRPFSNTSPQASRIGKMPITIPAGVKLTLHPPPPLKKGDSARLKPTRYLLVEGPRGELKLDIPDYMSIVPVAEQDASTPDAESAVPVGNADPSTRSRKIEVRVMDSAVRTQRAMWGTSRQYISNYIVGVAEGHSVILRLVGVGYRASIEDSATTEKAAYPGQKFVNLKVGYSHPIELGLPQGVSATCPVPTRILLEGNDKEVVKQFAAEIREWRKPEPYKGKGIFVGDETIKLKSKSIK